MLTSYDMQYGKRYMMFHLIVDYLHVLNYLFSLFIALFKFILIDCLICYCDYCLK